MIKSVSKILLTSCFCCCAVAEPPNGELAITYQQLEGDKLSESYHELTLTCYDGDCSLRTVTFNQCLDRADIHSDKPERVAFIKVEASSTKSGDLTIESSTDSSLALYQKLNGARFTYRFEFTTISNSIGTKIMGLRRDLWFAELSDFSGAATKSSDIAKQVIAWNLVPVRSPGGGHFASVQATCPIRVSALPQKVATPPASATSDVKGQVIKR